MIRSLTVALLAGVLVAGAAHAQTRKDSVLSAGDFVVGVAQNFDAAFYVFDGPDRDNNMANCGTARGAGLNAGLYLVCLPMDQIPETVRVGSRGTWVTVFEKSGAPVLTFVVPDRTQSYKGI